MIISKNQRKVRARNNDNHIKLELCGKSESDSKEAAHIFSLVSHCFCHVRSIDYFRVN